MKKLALLLATAATLAVILPKPNGLRAQSLKVSPPETTTLEEDSYVAGEILVKFKEDPQMRPANWLERNLLGRPKIKTNQPSLNEVNKVLGVQEVERVSLEDAPLYKIEVGEGTSIQNAVEEFEEDTAVEYAEPNYIYRTLSFPNSPPNDPYYQYQWNLRTIKAQEAWRITQGDPSVVVAVLDTGVAYENHTNEGATYAKSPGFSTTQFAPGYDFINDDSHPNDDHGHGTHVAAIIAEDTNDNRAAAGIAPQVSIMPIKVLDASGSGSLAAIVKGIRFATANGARVINMSLGGPSESQTMREACAAAFEAGVAIFAAAGNEANEIGWSPRGRGVIYPARFPEVIAVGATRTDNRRATYSSYGPNLDLVAPGGQVYGDSAVGFLDQNGDQLPDGILQTTINSVNPNRFTSVGGIHPTTGLRCTTQHQVTQESCGLFQGTSMAAPHAAAGGALLLSRDPSLSPTQIRRTLQKTAQDLGPAGRDDQYGYGLINLKAALQSLEPVEPTITQAQVARAIQEQQLDWTTKTYSQPRTMGAQLPNLTQMGARSAPKATPANLPPAIDWRDHSGNYVSPVKNQGYCGSCWAFASVGALESQYAVANSSPGSFADFSEQIPVSCCDESYSVTYIDGNDYHNLGCDGGYMFVTAQFLKELGDDVDTCFPYTESDEDPCADACTNWQTAAIKVTDYEAVAGVHAYPTVEELKTGLQHGPLATIFRIFEDFYESYGGGVYEYATGPEVSPHAVLLVGYVDTPDQHGGGHFVVKNSWGTTWGEAGFFRIGYSQVTNNVEFGLQTFRYIMEPSATDATLIIKTPTGSIATDVATIAGVAVTAGNLETTVTLTRSGNTFEGTISLEGISPGDLEVTVKVPLHISIEGSVVIAPGANTLDLTSSPLLGGDLDGDDAVGLGDITMLIIEYDGNSPTADINFDGVVGLADIATLIINYDSAR